MPSVPLQSDDLITIDGVRERDFHLFYLMSETTALIERYISSLVHVYEKAHLYKKITHSKTSKVMLFDLKSIAASMHHAKVLRCAKSEIKVKVLRLPPFIPSSVQNCQRD